MTPTNKQKSYSDSMGSYRQIERKKLSLVERSSDFTYYYLPK